MTVDYQRLGETAIWEQGAVTVRASEIRREGRTKKAMISLFEGGRLLDEDDIGLNRREERLRLSNACHANLNGSGPLYPKERLYHDLMLFCRDLWGFWVETGTGERVAGSSERTRPLWLLEPYLLQGAGTILFAPPGRGKSWTGLLWAVSIDAGLDWPWPTVQGPALYINLERSKASIAARLGDVNHVLGLPRERALLLMNRRGARLVDVWDAAQKTVQAEGIVLVVLDSLSRGGFGNLNDNEPANQGMDALNALGCAWLALGHTPAGDEDKIFGSEMFRAAADLTVQLKTAQRESTLGIGLEVRKANDVAWPRPQQWAYEFDELGLSAVREADVWEFEEVAPPQTLKDRIVAHLLEQGRDDATNIANATGVARRTVADLLRNHRDFRFVGKDGKRALFCLAPDVAVHPPRSATLPRPHHDQKNDVAADSFSKGSATSPHENVSDSEEPW